MANVERINIPRLPDRAIVDCFKLLSDKYNVPEISVTALAFSQLGNIDLNGEDNEDFLALLKHDSTLINVCTIRIAGLSISYHRGGRNTPEQQSPIFDEVVLSWNQQKGDLSNKDRLDIVVLINAELKAYEPGRFIETGLSEEQNQLLSIHQSTLDRLERLNEHLIKQSSDFRENIEQRFEKKTSELEEEIKAKKDKLNTEHEKRTSEVENKNQELADKLDAIDDRDNTHVRRAIRDKMLSDVKDRIDTFGVSKSTEKKRIPVFIGILLMIVAITLLLIYSIFQLELLRTDLPTNGSIDSSRQYWLWIKIALLSIGLVGTILYYIRWQNRWAEQHASSEFQLQQFHIDVNRANWVIESCLEWRKETESVIPTALLESITRNLFENNTDDIEKAVHPSDELASALLGSASKLKMKVGENELEFDKPGKIKPPKTKQ